jgi:hypothetical protein
MILHFMLSSFTLINIISTLSKNYQTSISIAIHHCLLLSELHLQHRELSRIGTRVLLQFVL